MFSVVVRTVARLSLIVLYVCCFAQAPSLPFSLLSSSLPLLVFRLQSSSSLPPTRPAPTPRSFHLLLILPLPHPTYVLADIMELKRMMEKLGQAKTHLELKKMIAEVDTTNTGNVARCVQPSWYHYHTKLMLPYIYGSACVRVCVCTCTLVCSAHKAWLIDHHKCLNGLPLFWPKLIEGRVGGSGLVYWDACAHAVCIMCTCMSLWLCTLLSLTTVARICVGRYHSLQWLSYNDVGKEIFCA